MLARVTDLALTTLPLFTRDDGELTVVESGAGVPFKIARVFTIRGPKTAKRGIHAHKKCTQFMISPHGAIDVLCDDGSDRRTFRLDTANLALLVPPGLWATETFVTEASILLVLCDRPYEPDDYISDHAEFVAWRRKQG